MGTSFVCRANVRKDARTMNEVRAQRIAQALQYYRVVGLRDESDMETVITDCLVDLRHLCDALKLDFGKVDRLAYRNYLEERYQE